MTIAVLSRVMSGWTGVLTLAGVAVTPMRRESVASLWCRAVRDVYAQTGVQLELDPWDDFVSGSATFTWSSTGNIYTRSGFADPAYSGASSYYADSTFTGWLAGKYGAHVNPGAQRERAGIVGSGASAQAPTAKSKKAVIQIHIRATPTVGAESAENDVNIMLAGLASNENVYDVWHGNRVVERCRINGVSRVGATRDRNATTSVMRVDLDVQGVLE